MSKIAVIPARGGSKRIPNKNVKLFCGKPIIAYSIEAALLSDCFDRVIVSTDDEEIARIALDSGAEVPFFRSEALANDFAVVTDVVVDTIQKMEKITNEIIEYACLIYATAPLINAEYIKKGFNELYRTGKDFSIGLTNYPFPIQRALSIEAGAIKQLFNDRDTRSQDLSECYHDAAHFCWGTKSAFLNKKDFFSESACPILIPRKFVQDIDTIEDWEIAEELYKSNKYE